MSNARVADARAAAGFAAFLATFVEQTGRARDETAGVVEELERRCDEARVSLARRSGSLQHERTDHEYALRRSEPGSPEHAAHVRAIERIDADLERCRQAEAVLRDASDRFFSADGEYRSAAGSAAVACVEAERHAPALAERMRILIHEY